MKLFAFIMACIVLVLAFLPCIDEVFPASSPTIMTEISKSNSEHSTGHSDVCSPFCNYSCCSGFSINHSIASITNPGKFYKQSLSFLLAQNVIEISLPVWEPPRL